MNERKHLIKNTGIIAIGNLSTKLVSFLLLPLYTSLLSTSEYGTIDYITSISLFCIPFVSLLMDESMFRFLIDCKTEKEKSNVISSSLLLILIGCILFSIVCLPILIYIKYEYSLFFLIYIYSSVISMMISALLRGIGRTDKYAVFNFLTSMFNAVLNVIFIAFLDLGVKGMLSAFIFSQLGISIIYIAKEKLWKYIKLTRVDYLETKKMLTYSIPLIPNKVSWSIINLSSRIIIMNLLGSNVAGLYAVANKFPTLMDTIYGFFYQSWKESSARVIDSENQSEFYNSVYTSLKKFMYSVVIIMVAFMPLAFRFLIDVSFYDAILYVPILLLGTYFSNISGFYGGIFTAYKDTKIMGTTTMIAAILNIFLNIVFINWIGLFAAALATLIANLVVYFYRKQKVKKYIYLNEDYKDKFISCLITVIIFILYYTQDSIFLIVGAIIALIYAVVQNKHMITFLYNKIKRG